MNPSYEQLIQLFCTESKKIPGVYDLLLRGSAGKNGSDRDFVDDWSDLDFSIIVESMTSDVRKQVQKIYRRLKQETKIKITITLVDRRDFENPNHCHGNRPIYYSYLLSHAKSLLRSGHETSRGPFQTNLFIRENCFANISYLIHDLRQGYMVCDETLLGLQTFCQHLVKRSGHLIRNAIFLQTGMIDESINEALLATYFPTVDRDLPKKLSQVRRKWSQFNHSISTLSKFIDYIFENIELIYSMLIEQRKEKT